MTAILLRGGIPRLFEALGVTFDLEDLRPPDADRLARVNAMVKDWFGPHLRQTNHALYDEIAPFRPEDLEYVEMFAHNGAPIHTKDQLWGWRYRSGFSLAVNGATDSAHASPWSYSFVQTEREDTLEETPEREVPEHRGSKKLIKAIGRIAPIASALRLTVPADWPLADFRARVLAIADELRLRWAAAGLTYAHWMAFDPAPVGKALGAHAKKHPGFDVGYDRTGLELFHDQLRTVQWLTVLGPNLSARVEVTPTEHLRVETRAGGLVVQAGDAPQRGDTNRRKVPVAYAEADRAMRAVRGSDGSKLGWMGFSRETATAWLRRFEGATT